MFIINMYVVKETGSVNLQTSVTRPSYMNILDLVVTSNPNIITDVQVVPGMSDHDIVLFQINMSPKIQRKPPHRIYKYDLQDIPKIKGHIRSRTDHFLSSDPHTKSVDENWTFFKDTIRDAMAQYIPSKMSKTKQSHPWITSEIKRQMRKRDKLYCKAKKTKLRDIWTKYTHQRNKVTNMMTSSYDNYMANIIGSSLEPGGNQKRFWSFIRSQRKEMSGIPALEAEGEIYSTDRGKAQALNAQCVSVFTQPDSTSLPDKGPSLYQDIPALDIGLQGIVKQLARLKVNKAGGPDDVPARVLHDYAEDLGRSWTYADLHHETIIWRQHSTQGLAKGHGHWNIQEGQEVIS